jgi:Helix-turn-helix domain
VIGSPHNIAAFSVAQVAAKYGVDAHAVLAWIRGGELSAIDVAHRRGRRPRWRISQDAIDAFESARSSRPQQVTARRPRAKSAGVIQFV